MTIHFSLFFSYYNNDSTYVKIYGIKKNNPQHLNQVRLCSDTFVIGT